MTNPACDRLLGYKAKELIGRESLELVAPASRDVAREAFARQSETRRDVTLCVPVLRADGSRISLQIATAFVPVDQRHFRILTLHRQKEDAATEMRSENAGRISLIGLDEVRAALGDRWQAAADRAMTTAEAVLRRRCGPQDSYSRAGETSFVVCFGALSEQEAAFRAAMIGREIRDKLSGQGEASDTALVRAIAAKVRVPAWVGQSDSHFHASLLDSLDKQLVQVEEQARQTLRSAWAGSRCNLIPVTGAHGGKIVANEVCLPNLLEQQLLIALSALPSKECEVYDLDTLMVGLAAQQAISDMRHGVTTPLHVNVRFDVFLTPAATQRLLITCRKIDPRISNRLVLLLSGLPQGLPRSRLLDCVSRLRPFCGGVGYHVNDLAAAEMLDLSNSFNPVVVLPFAAVRHGERLKRTVAALQARGARVMIGKVVSDKDGAALRSLGVDMIAMSLQASGTVAAEAR